MPLFTIPIFAHRARPQPVSPMAFFKDLFGKRTALNLLAALLVAALLVWAAFAWLDHYTCHGCAIEVPDLDGYQVEIASDITEKVGLRYVVVDSIYDEQAEPGAIVEQDPKAGASVKEGRRIYLVINRREREQVLMEDLTNRSPREAILIVRSMGLNVGELVPKPSPHTDLVLDQLYNGTRIEPGTEIFKGETITLVVAAGASGEKTMVPSLIGLNLIEAQVLLQEHSLNLGAPICADCQTAKDSMELSRIYRQSPISNEESLIDLGAYVDVWLSINPDKTQISIEKESGGDQNNN